MRLHKEKKTLKRIQKIDTALPQVIIKLLSYSAPCFRIWYGYFFAV